MRRNIQRGEWEMSKANGEVYDLSNLNDIDTSNVEVVCLGKLNATEYIRGKVVEMLKREENSLHLY